MDNYLHTIPTPENFKPFDYIRDFHNYQNEGNNFDDFRNRQLEHDFKEKIFEISSFFSHPVLGSGFDIKFYADGSMFTVSIKDIRIELMEYTDIPDNYIIVCYSYSYQSAGEELIKKLRYLYTQRKTRIFENIMKHLNISFKISFKNGSYQCIISNEMETERLSSEKYVSQDECFADMIARPEFYDFLKKNQKFNF